MRNQQPVRAILFLCTSLILIVGGCALDAGSAGLPVEDPTTGITLTPEQLENVHNVPSSIPVCARSAEGCRPPVRPPVRPPIEVPSPLTGLCPSLGSPPSGMKTPLLATVDKNTLEFVDYNGEVNLIDLPVDGLNPTAIKTADVRYEAPYFAVRRHFLADPSQFNEVSTALSVVDKDGNVLWHRIEHGCFVHTFFVLDDGSVMANKTYPWTVGMPYKEDALWVHSDGSATDIPGWVVLGPPLYMPNSLSQRVVPVREHTGADRVGWYDLDTGAFVQVAEGQISHLATLFQDHFVWLQEGKTAPWLMVASRGEVGQIHPLWDIPVSDTLQIVQSVAPHWLHIFDYVTQQSWRVKLDLFQSGTSVAEVLPIGSTPPHGLKKLETKCSGIPATMDKFGRLLLFLRDSQQAWAYRLDPATQAYEAVGAALSQTAGGPIYATESSYVVHANDNGSTFCPVLDWEQLAEDKTTLSGKSTQVVHPDTGNTYVIDPPLGNKVTLDTFGLCFLTERWDADAGVPTYTVTDIMEGTKTEIELSKSPYWLN